MKILYLSRVNGEIEDFFMYYTLSGTILCIFRINNLKVQGQ